MRGLPGFLHSAGLPTPSPARARCVHQVIHPSQQPCDADATIFLLSQARKPRHRDASDLSKVSRPVSGSQGSRVPVPNHLPTILLDQLSNQSWCPRVRAVPKLTAVCSAGRLARGQSVDEHLAHSDARPGSAEGRTDEPWPALQPPWCSHGRTLPSPCHIRGRGLREQSHWQEGPRMCDSF